MNIIIRYFKKEDTKEIINLYNECFNTNIDYHDIILNSNKKIIVAEANDMIVGLTEIDVLKDSITNKNYFLINSVCTKKDFQNKGIGTSLMNKVDALAKEENCSYLMLTSNKSRTSAHHLYLKCGFEIYDTCVFKKYINY